MIMQKRYKAWTQCYGLALLLLLCQAMPGKSFAAEDNSWLVGRWQLHYDPDGSDTDYLVFKANGDFFNIDPQGHEVHGFYMVVPGAVRAVLTTKEGKDLLLTFFYNKAKTELRIVTSDSGIESVYIKVK